MRRRITCDLLSLCMLIVLMPPTFAEFADTEGHWAEKQIKAWAARGIVQGYQGEFSPDAKITRGDIATIIDRLMRYETAEENPFSDVAPDKYYAQPILKLYHVGVMQGSSKNTAQPKELATRQEAIVMLARAFKVSAASNPKTLSFLDADDVSAWALDAVTAFVEHGYIHGDDRNCLRPLEPISRAEFVTILDNMVAELAPGDAALAGTDDMLLINQPEITISDRAVGTVFVAPGVGDGTVILENVTMDHLYILGGGEHSVIIRGNSRVRSVQIAKQDDGVRVLVSGNAEVEIVRIDDGCNNVILSGRIGTVAVDSSQNEIKFVDAKVGNLTIAGASTEISIDKDSVIGRLSIADSATNATVANAGQIGTVDIDNPSAKVTRVDTGGGSGSSGGGNSGDPSGGGGSSGGGGGGYIPPDPSIPKPPTPVQTIFGLTIRVAGHGVVRAEEVADPTPTPTPTPTPEPIIDPERDGYLLTLRSAGHGNILAEEYVEPVTPTPEPSEYILKIQMEGQGTVIIEED